MATALQNVNSRRVWFVPSLKVWGLPHAGEFEYLAMETVDSIQTVYYGATDIGDSSQQVSFADLVDHRGNNLPASIDSPRVIVRQRSEDPAFVVGEESDSSFKIARSASVVADVNVDLVVIEMGG